jgi:hypothetical protein
MKEMPSVKKRDSRNLVMPLSPLSGSGTLPPSLSHHSLLGKKHSKCYSAIKLHKYRKMKQGRLRSVDSNIQITPYGDSPTNAA